MTRPATPANVAAAAALPQALPMNQLTLIGLMTTPISHAALLRSPAGEIARVLPGDSVFGLQIDAIDDKALILTDAQGNVHRLVMPA